MELDEIELIGSGCGSSNTVKERVGNDDGQLLTHFTSILYDCIY